MSFSRIVVYILQSAIIQAVRDITRFYTTGIVVKHLLGERTQTMYKEAKSIIKYHFQREFPKDNIDKLEDVLNKYSADEIIRFADMISRFGIAAILNVVTEGA